MPKTKIELSPEDAKIFKWFRKHQETWRQISKIRGGKAILYFDNNGNLMQAHSDKTIFKRKTLDKGAGLRV